MKRTQNLKFLENKYQIFENYKKNNKKTQNLKIDTRFNKENIFGKKILEKKIQKIKNCKEQEHKDSNQEQELDKENKIIFEKIIL